MAIAALSIRAARRRVPYETWHGIHLLTYVAIALSFVHELAGPNLAGYLWVQVAWSLLYLYAVGLVLRYRLVAPLLAMWRHRLRVVAVIPETNGVASVIMRGRPIGELAAQPGQFFRWRFMTAVKWVSAHPFSLSAPPQGDRLRITVKNLGTAVGSCIRFSRAPWFSPRALRRDDGAAAARPSVLLIAGGVGITPMRALFETLPLGDGRLDLVYRAASKAEIVFRDELELIAERRGTRIHWMVGPSADPANRFSAETCAAWCRTWPTGTSTCAPHQACRGAVRQALRAAGCPTVACMRRRSRSEDATAGKINVEGESVRQRSW